MAVNQEKPKKVEPVKSKQDEKKEQMRNALFSGISTAKNDSDSDSDKVSPPKQEIDLLEMGG